VVKTNSTFIKRTGVRRIGKLMKPNEGLTFDKPDSASKWAGAFVQDELHVEESFVPRNTAVEIIDRKSHVGDCRELRHGKPPRGSSDVRSPVILARMCSSPVRSAGRSAQSPDYFL
jgi:hypothetical protein